jgi:hypothetical protein
MEAIESLKKMIRSWLDDTFPEMLEADRITMAESMDVSMVERKKEGAYIANESTLCCWLRSVHKCTLSTDCISNRKHEDIL